MLCNALRRDETNNGNTVESKKGCTCNCTDMTRHFKIIYPHLSTFSGHSEIEDSQFATLSQNLCWKDVSACYSLVHSRRASFRLRSTTFHLAAVCLNAFAASLSDHSLVGSSCPCYNTYPHVVSRSSLPHNAMLLHKMPFLFVSLYNHAWSSYLLLPANRPIPVSDARTEMMIMHINDSGVTQDCRNCNGSQTRSHHFATHHLGMPMAT